MNFHVVCMTLARLALFVGSTSLPSAMPEWPLENNKRTYVVLKASLPRVPRSHVVFGVAIQLLNCASARPLYVPLKQFQGWGPTSTPLGITVIPRGGVLQTSVMTRGGSLPPSIPRHHRLLMLFALIALSSVGNRLLS